jgi:hypothetical protein
MGKAGGVKEKNKGNYGIVLEEKLFIFLLRCSVRYHCIGASQM